MMGKNTKTNSNLNKTKVIVICGPTSSGKTSLALKYCKDKPNFSIISCDSRQIFKFMDIGTGKEPVDFGISEIKKRIVKDQNKWMFDGVDIWGYDLALPSDYFSGYDYCDFGLKKATELHKKGNQFILVGGTGFWIDMFTQRVIPSRTKPDFELRKGLENKNLDDLGKDLMSLNLQAYNNIDKNNRFRLIRAIEKELSVENNNTPLPYLDVEYEFIGLTAPRDFLYNRVDKWVDLIWAKGLVDEVNNLINLGYSNSPRMFGLIYKTVISYIKGDIDENEAKQLIKYDLHSYIRRQQTYFKKNKEIKWFDITQDNYIESIYNLINGQTDSNFN